MNNTQQIITYARHGTAVARLARNSRCPGNLVKLALRIASKLIHVSRTLPDIKEATKCWRAGCMVESMIVKHLRPDQPDFEPWNMEINIFEFFDWFPAIRRNSLVITLRKAGYYAWSELSTLHTTAPRSMVLLAAGHGLSIK